MKMSETTLTKSETAILTKAAGRQDGLVVLPETTARHLIGKRQDGLTFYRIVEAAKTPRKKRAGAGDAAEVTAAQ
jgi:hypothetical protein